ncbi:hypothetical protein G6F57_020101 [Rhizopus arrhizus]|nr:hypothetical protein G6F22_021305 [Rhizopus arrhizus]KAG1437816.1 hypothetical protein G6F57_020101 [Rhizopus arrhizus]
MLEQLDGLDPAHRFQKVRLLFRSMDDVLFGGIAQRRIARPARQAVQRHGAHGDPRQRWAVQEHQHQRDHHDNAIQQGLEKRRGDGALNGVDGAEARHDVAQVPLFEIADR